VLSITPTRWRNVTASLSHELLTRRPLPGEWSAADCLHHLLDAEIYVFPRRVEAFLAGRDFAAFDPDAQGTLSDAEQNPSDWAEEFARLREASLSALSRLTPADFTRTARHSELGIVTLSELLHEWAGHDLMHTVQAERALMQPFIDGCGPWRSYFRDHDVSQKGLLLRPD
jgi:hypothetical protein